MAPRKKPGKATKKSSAGKRASEVPVKHQGGSLQSLIDFNFQDIEKLFQDFFGRPALRAGWRLPDFEDLRATMATRLPDIDVVERGKEVLVKAELPGCDCEDIEITLADGSVKITAAHVEEKEDKDENFLRREISTREYKRTIPVPTGVDVGKATAEMKRGVLHIHFPKSESPKAKRLPIN